MTFSEHILSARPWVRRWGARQGPCRTQAGCLEGINLVSHRALGVRGWGGPSAGDWGAGIPQLEGGVTGVWEPQTLD